MSDTLTLYDTEVTSRFMLGTSLYPSPAVMVDAINRSACEIVTVSLRRESGSGREGQEFWEIIKSLNLKVLPNTAGCHTAKEAITTAMMAREAICDDTQPELFIQKDNDDEPYRQRTSA